MDGTVYYLPLVVAVAVAVAVVVLEARGSGLPGASLLLRTELIWSPSFAMALRIVDFDYCPDLPSYRKGKDLCLVATPVCLDDQQTFHRLATVLQEQHFTYKGSLPADMASYTLLKVVVEQEGKIPALCEGEETIMLCHPHCT